MKQGSGGLRKPESLIDHEHVIDALHGQLRGAQVCEALVEGCKPKNEFVVAGVGVIRPRGLLSRFTVRLTIPAVEAGDFPARDGVDDRDDLGVKMQVLRGERPCPFASVAF